MTVPEASGIAAHHLPKVDLHRRLAVCLDRRTLRSVAAHKGWATRRARERANDPSAVDPFEVGGLCITRSVRAESTSLVSRPPHKYDQASGPTAGVQGHI